MGKVIVLNLSPQSDNGYQVTLAIHNEGQIADTEVAAQLPPAPDLLAQSHDWQVAYRNLSQFHHRSITVNYVGVDTTFEGCLQDCCKKSQQLQQAFNTWLRSPSFQPIRETWIETIDKTAPVRVIVRTAQQSTRHLPWHTWEFVDRYQNSEIAFGAPTYRRPSNASAPPSETIRILAILGNSEGLDVDQDCRILKALPGAEVKFLNEPQRQAISDELWEQPWDILFFAGHSRTEGDTGRIYLNQTDNLTLSELRYGLQKAVNNGLQLAIFNSCDGLGLANELEQLQIPQLIVMREPVPDRVAQEFLKYFLGAFSQGRSLYLSVREARERLQCLENQYPNASWLPVIIQNPAVIPPTWAALAGQANQATAIGDSTASTAATETNHTDTNHIDFETLSLDGAVSLDSPLYVKSPFQDNANKALKLPGALIRIRSPKGMGKSSFTLRLLNFAQTQNYRTVTLDFRQTNAKVLQNLDKFAQWFCAAVGRDLGIARVKLEDYWDDIFGPNDNCTEYFEKYLLSDNQSPLTLALENFDRLFDYPDIINDLCGLLRGWHEKAKRDAIWAQLRLVIVYSQESYEPKDINQSPFNVGFPVKLGPWSQAQVAMLVERYGLVLSTEELDQLMTLTGGHPQLVRKALYIIATGESPLTDIFATAATEAGIYQAHLLERLSYLEAHPGLKEAMHRIVHQDSPVRVKPQDAYKLDSIGLVQIQNYEAVPLCQIYRDYFRERLTES